MASVKVPKVEVFKTEDDDDNDTSMIPEGLPKPPFRIVLSGCTHCGKSNIIKNYLFNDKFGYNKYFDEIYIFSGSLDDCNEYKRLAARNKRLKDKIQIEQKFNDEEVKKLIKEIEDSNEKADPGCKSNALFIYDDQMCNKLTTRGKLNSTDEIFSRGRHGRISTMVSTQKFNEIDINCRANNAGQVYVFNGTSEADLKAIAHDHCGTMDEKSFAKLIKNNIKEKYSYVIIDTQAQNSDEKLKKWVGNDLTVIKP